MKKLATFLSVVAMLAVAPLARANWLLSVNGDNFVTPAPANPSQTPGGAVGVCSSVQMFWWASQHLQFVSTKGTLKVISELPSNLRPAWRSITTGAAG